MAQGRLTEHATRTEHANGETPPPDSCPDCGGALSTRDVHEHLPCGRVHFAGDAERSAPCPKCNESPDDRDVVRRGAVRVCSDCGHTEDATGVAGVSRDR